MKFIEPKLKNQSQTMALKSQLTIPTEALVTFCQTNGIRKLSLFGSVLRPDFTDQSDVDVLVEFWPGQTPGLRIVTLQQELSDIFRRQVDLRTPKELSRYFRERVLSEALTLYDGH